MAYIHRVHFEWVEGIFHMHMLMTLLDDVIPPDYSITILLSQTTFGQVCRLYHVPFLRYYGVFFVLRFRLFVRVHTTETKSF